MDPLVANINGLNQRGGRMLSITDLLAAGTLDITLAAYLMRALHNGISLITCAGPGGVGKTTLLGALLCFLPRDAALTVVEGPEPATWYSEQASGDRSTWFLCHELGSGPWYSYLWGKAASAFLAAPANKARLFCATTAHADSMAELEASLCQSSIGLRAETLRKHYFVLFIRALRHPGTNALVRRVTAVYVPRPDDKPHAELCRWHAAEDRWIWTPDSELPAAPARGQHLLAYEQFLQQLFTRQIKDVATVRQEVVHFYRELSAMP